MVRCADGRLKGERWKPTALGDGMVGWRSHLEQLHAQGFDGPISLELHLGPKARQGARDAYSMIQLVRAAQRGASG